MTAVGILPLKCFDMVLGEDWLEDCSPMWVHWSNKVMRFTYQGKRIELYGVRQKADQCAEITAQCLHSLLTKEAIQFYLQFKADLPRSQVTAASSEVHAISLSDSVELPVEIKKLLSDYKDLFQEPT